MSKILEFLKGRKTYFLMAGAILTAIGGYLGGELSTKELIEALFLALGMIGLRLGVSKVQ